MGALMKKIALHPSAPVSTPPTSGPADSAALAPTAQRPTARARSLGSGKVWFTSVSEQGTRSAAPTGLIAKLTTLTSSCTTANPRLVAARVRPRPTRGPVSVAASGSRSLLPVPGI